MKNFKVKQFWRSSKGSAATEAGFILTLSFIVCLGFIDLVRMFAVINSLETTVQYAANEYMLNGNDLTAAQNLAKEHVIWFAKDCLAIAVDQNPSQSRVSLPVYKFTANCDWSPISQNLFPNLEMQATIFKAAP